LDIKHSEGGDEKFIHVTGAALSVRRRLQLLLFQRLTHILKRAVHPDDVFVIQTPHNAYLISHVLNASRNLPRHHLQIDYLDGASGQRFQINALLDLAIEAFDKQFTD